MLPSHNTSSFLFVPNEGIFSALSDVYVRMEAGSQCIQAFQKYCPHSLDYTQEEEIVVPSLNGKKNVKLNAV